MKSDNIEKAVNKKLFSIKNKYFVALIAGVISAGLVILSDNSSISNIAMISGLILVIAYGIFTEMKSNEKISKKIIGVLLSLFLVPIVFNIGNIIVVKIAQNM